MNNKKEIKVLYIERKPDFYGSCLSLLSMLEYLTKNGITPLIIVISEGELTKELKKRGIPYKTIMYFFNTWPRLKTFKDYILFIPKLIAYTFYNRLAILKLKKVAQNFKTDIIHTNIGPSHIGISVAKKLRIPHIWHLREYQDFGYSGKIFPSKSEFIKKLHKKWNYNIAITNGIATHFNLSNNNSEVIPDGIFHKTETIIDFNKDKFFLFVGRISNAKGIKEVLKAFSEFCKKNENYKLLIAGKIEIACNGDVYTTRAVILASGSSYRKLMSRATSLIQASKMEGLGRVTIEAMFCGCLVVGRNSGGTIEILGEKDLGLLYNKNSELIAILDHLAKTDIDFYKDKIERAQKEAVSLYSIEESGKKILNYYNKTLDITNSNL